MSKSDNSPPSWLFGLIGIIIMIMIVSMTYTVYPQAFIDENLGDKRYIHTGIVVDLQFTTSGLLGNFHETILVFEDGTIITLNGRDFNIVIGDKYGVYYLHGYIKNYLIEPAG